MKKLLSICFLSIFLLMFGMQAQAQTDCCFSLSNPSGDTIHGLVNVPGGDLPQNHSMNPLQWHNTDSYALQFSDASCLSITGNTKVSIELELWLDGENVLDGQHDLSNYCNITMQTTYNELHWVGSPMIGSNYPYAFEYPGAIQIFSGTYNISNVNFDYFFFNFLLNSQTKVMITWNQVFRDAMLIAHVRERIHGTNHEFYWDDQQRLNVGGHQSHPGRILASDTISTDRFPVSSDSIQDCESVTVGVPAYTMDTTGTYKVAYLHTSGCNTKIDSVVTYYYTHYVHPTTPTLHDSTFRYCQKGTATPIVLPDEPNAALADHVADIVPYWYFADGDSFRYAASLTPVTDTTAGNYYYYVKRHDNVTGCESEIDTFVVTINPNPANPVVTNPIVEYCVGATATPLTYPAPTGMQVIWGTHPDIDSLSPTPITPSTANPDTMIYYLRLQDTTTVNRCISEEYDSITVRVFANPVVSITHDNDSLCYSNVVTLTANPSTLSTYVWSKNGALLPNDTLYTLTDTNWTAVEAFVKYSLAVTEKHDSVNCAANAVDSIKVYPLIGTPTPVVPAAGDTSICGPGDVAFTVAAGTNGTTARWYKADKSTVIATDTLRQTIHFDATDSIFVSSLNANGCETPDTSWLKITVTVDTIPTVVLSADNNAEVCAESDLIIRSTVTPSYTPITYYWSGPGLTPANKDSVVFNHATAGQYIDTLRIKDAHGCIAMDTILVTVDTLPQIVNGVNYTIRNNEYCVGTNGKIEFLTPDYVKYSIDSAWTWRTTKVFDTLAVGHYNLMVEDGNGCKNHANAEDIVKDTINPTLTITDSANTRCAAPFNGKLMVSAAPATGAFIYQLNDGAAQTDSVFAALADGNTYKITVTDTITGCKTDSLNQVVTDGKIIPIPTLTSTNNTHCDIDYDGTITITAVTPATGAYHYRLTSTVLVPDPTPYQTSTLFSGLYHGFYTAIVEDTLTACVGSDTITVKYDGLLPTATVMGPDYICYGDTNTVFSVNITDPNVYFTHWSYVGSVPDTTINTFRTLQAVKLKNYNTGEAFPPGTHILMAHVRDTVTHCENIIKDTLRVISVNIDLLTIPNTTVCEYDTVKVYSHYIQADPSDAIVTYTWFNGNHVEYVAPGVYDTALVIPTSSASYVSLIVVDNHGCSGAFGRTISVWKLPAITISSDTAYCKGSNHNLVVTLASTNTPLDVEWWQGAANVHSDPSLTTPLISTYNKTVNNDTTLVITVEDVHGCINQKDYNLVAVELPGDPYFDNNPDYFCTNDDIAITVHQQAPISGNLVWNTTDPNVTKLPGSYTAHFELAVQSSTCRSADSTVVVSVPGKPTFNIALKYNSEGSATTSKARCYDAAAGDTINMTVTSTAIGTMAYTYEFNNVAHTGTQFVITETEPGTYNDTIKINATQTYPDGTSCDWDTTVYYTLTVNPLPVAPNNFPHAYNGTSDSVIFYCAGSTASYTFAPQTGFTYTYNPGGSTAPTTAGTVQLIVTNNTTGCVDSFPYKIVEVPTPQINLTHTASLKNCGQDNILDTITVNITNTIDASYTRFFVWNPGDSVAKFANADTNYHTFNANDTMITVRIGVYAANGDFTATCYKTPSPDTIVKVLFQERPAMPKLDPAYTYYVDSAHAAYCASELGTFSLTASHFLAIPGATINIIGHSTGVDTAGVYQVVANNDVAPYCPSDTLTLYVREKRTPADPTNIGTGMYDHKVYFCAGSTPVYNFVAADAKDEFLYSADGINFFTTAPDTAGSYTLRVRDIDDSCYNDVTFDIIEVANPNYTVSVLPAANWVDTNICQGSNFVMSYNSNVVNAYTPTTGVNQKQYSIWDATDTNTTHNYNFAVTADTNLTFAFVAYDTIGNTGYGVACSFAGYYDTISITYFATPAAPVYTGDTTFCAGDTVFVTESNFSYATGLNLTTDVTLPDTITATSSIIASVSYPTFSACKSADTTIHITKYNLPTVTIAPAAVTMCEGDTTILKVTGAETYVWSNASTIDSVFATDSIAYSVIGTDVHGCVNYDTVKVNFYPTFAVVMSHDTTVCLNSDAQITAEVIGGSHDFTFEWFKDTASTAFATTPTGIFDVQLVHPDTSKRVNGSYIPNYYSVKVTDNTSGCDSRAADNVVAVSAIAGPYIIFREVDSTKTSRYMHVDENNQSAFEMYIVDKGECPCNQDKRVFIDFQIYKNGVPMTDPEVGEVMDHFINTYSMMYDFDLTVGAGNIPSLLFQSTTSNAAGFIPDITGFSALGQSDKSFDWVFMHFLLGVENSDHSHNGRKITVNTGMWKPGSSGVYTFSYAVIVAGVYSSQVAIPYEGIRNIGGYGSHTSLFVKDTIVSDFFTIYVGDSVYNGSTSTFNFNANNPTDVTTYPAVEEQKQVDMKVYPNPASNNVNVVLEGISGQTMITVHDMSGKAVSNMRVDVDNNGQIINLPVENYSQGIYFIKAVNGDAVMTKKLIIAR